MWADAVWFHPHKVCRTDKFKVTGSRLELSGKEAAKNNGYIIKIVESGVKEKFWKNVVVVALIF